MPATIVRASDKATPVPHGLMAQAHGKPLVAIGQGLSPHISFKATRIRDVIGSSVFRVVVLNTKTDEVVIGIVTAKTHALAKRHFAMTYDQIALRRVMGDEDFVVARFRWGP